ncbi:MAG: hypothetical protein JWN75_947 [Candidatus Saccharibacteria bacterium]|nr:hypothetical protein [Candidatus Saccharibacteria bacterium]
MDTARQQIVDSIKANSNILVSVSTDPTVDELSAALGLTILLNNLDKRSTAVFSGVIPAAINFLEPTKTFEDSADSLRDFIIALDKEKADHLRYKVEGDVVKIFITPYRTKLSQADLDFSQGDYNVELVIGLGVKDQDHLDKALESHGKILHDATVVTISAGTDPSTLGNIDWHDETASSLSEMIASLADALKDDKPLLDEQTSTALLTGIVSSTDRFSNDRTSSKVMTMAAQLMAAGANQQLIAAKLEEAHDIGSGFVATDSTASTPDQQSAEHATELSIERSDRRPKPAEKVIEPLPELPAVEPSEEPAAIETIDQLELEKNLANLTTPPAGTLEDIEKELQSAVEQSTPESAPEEKVPEPEVSLPDLPLTAASDVFMPGFEPTEITLPTATESEAPSTQINNEHGTFTTPPAEQSSPINSVQSDAYEGEGTVDPFAAQPLQVETPTMVPDFGAAVGTAQGAALLGGDPVAPPVQLDASGIPELPPLPPLPTFDTNLPPLPPPPPAPNFGQPASTTMSGAVSGDIFGDASATTPSEPAAPVATEPGQFKIPGQS